jgi:prepilin-type N-terminal cleavage/methylation domain-containing protein/prepilin-type processing-associated H-X9-DG protein
MIMPYQKEKAFTLIELLVVISVIVMLLALMMPALGKARAGTWALVCKSNLRQILIANISYTADNDGYFVPAASNMYDNAGLYRWHGSRDNLNEPFDPSRGPLAGYLGDGGIKDCPAKKDFLKGQDWNTNFEQGCGGYGYNMTYIGSRLWQNQTNNASAWKEMYAETTRMTEIGTPGKTLMFADTAMANDNRFLIEYSFAEPPFTIQNGRVITSFYMSPSIHFRHGDDANIGWADGHTGQHRLAKTGIKNSYGINTAQMKLGWFEPVNNTLFDLE